MRDKYLCFYGFLHTWLLGASLYYGVASVTGEISWNQILLSLILWIPIVVLYLVSRKGQKIWSYFLGLAGCLTFVFAVCKMPLDCFCLIALTLMVAGLFFAERLSGNQGILAAPGYGGLLLFAALYLAGSYFHKEKLEVFMTVFAGMYWLLILWKRNREASLRFFFENQQLHRFPGRRIASGNQWMLWSVSLLTIGGMILLPLTGLEQVVHALGKGLLALMRFFLSKEREHVPEEIPVEEMQGQVQMPFTGESNAPAFLTVLWEILEKVLLFAFTLGVIAGILYFLYWLYKRYATTRIENGDFVESLSKEPEERKTFRKTDKKICWLSKVSCEEQIRKYYKKKIRKHTGGACSVFHTPEELEDAAGFSNSSEKGEFHQLYEKARYGNQGCSSQEAARMKALDRLDF